jgi:AGCS family alanine or glycine:cation symporter
MIETLHGAVTWLNGFLWGPPMLVLLFGTHLFLTVRLKFIQRYLWQAIKLSFSNDRGSAGDVSQFGALMTALAATIGTGNIVGVSTAIALGGPGAVLWCWLTGVFGIATKYSEAVLAVRYRVQTADGTMLGGPMYALERGLGQKWLAVVFCVCTAVAAFGIGNTVQANSAAALMKESFSVPPLASGTFMAVLVALVLIGGVRWIARTCEVLVPFMALFYIIGCAIILYLNAAHVWPAIRLIVGSAFTPQAAGGGFAGSAVLLAARYGIARGLFSNESGLGSAPIIAAAAQTKNPVRQALVSSTGTFWDTVVVCAMTGVVIVSSILRDPAAFEAARSNGAVFTKMAFAQIPVVGPAVLTVGLLTFVFSTILGWSYYGERALEYLCGKRSILPYRLAWVAAVFCGSVLTMPFVWDVADAMNALMAIPNLVALIVLNRVVVAETQTYLWGHHLDDAGQ